MDTPEKTTQFTTSLSKFEDSPVFNYINNLSPIKPVKSINISQTFHPLSFASLPSIFASPHVSSHKESRFLTRYNPADPSQSESGNKVSSDEGGVVDAVQLYDSSTELHENFDPGLSIELPCPLNYDCNSPDLAITPRCGIQADCISESAGRLASLVPFSKDAPRREVKECDWESLISDHSDLLIFCSPIDTEAFKGLIQKPVEPNFASCNSLNEVDIAGCLGSCEQEEMENLSTQPGETIDLKEINWTQDDLAASNKPNKCVSDNANEKVDNKYISSNAFSYKAVSLHHGLRRRCLDFEMGGARRKNLDHGSSSSSALVQSDEKIGLKHKQLVPFKSSTDSSRCILPGIGLHLNALAISSKDRENANHEFPSSTVSLHPSTTGQELKESLALDSNEREMECTKNGVPIVEETSQAHGYLVGEDFDQSSPKKKRRKSEGENEACKRCNCKKSKCLKLYCECFAAGVYCIEPCACQDCFNKPIHEDTVLATRKQIESRNPLAFAPKVIRSTESMAEIGDESTKTPASARHKRGCNCKKSNCLKKYCECYQGGVGCSINCRCEGCKNAFGRKDGCGLTEMEAELEDETEACQNNGADKASQKAEILNNEEQTTPLPLCRSLIQMPFSSKGKPPMSYFSIGSTTGLHTNQQYAKPNILCTQPMVEKQFETVADEDEDEDEDMPEILQGSFSPGTSIKTLSPNGKRVSPPQVNLRSSPGTGRRSGRKLILQSIPSFPSLTSQH